MGVDWTQATHVLVELSHDGPVLLGRVDEDAGPVDEVDRKLLGLARQADLRVGREPGTAQWCDEGSARLGEIARQGRNIRLSLSDALDVSLCELRGDHVQHLYADGRSESATMLARRRKWRRTCFICAPSDGTSPRRRSGRTPASTLRCLLTDDGGAAKKTKSVQRLDETIEKRPARQTHLCCPSRSPCWI